MFHFAKRLQQHLLLRKAIGFPGNPVGLAIQAPLSRNGGGEKASPGELGGGGGGNAGRGLLG
jgi:hypothetical protein